MSTQEFNRMQTVKRRFFAMRNGVVADSLRGAGCPRKIIFGLNLPQLNEIAAEIGKDETLALALWADGNAGESQLLAPMIMPADRLTESQAYDLMADIQWPEEADIMANKLLRQLPFAPDVAARLCRSDDRLRRYAGLRLWLAITCINIDESLRKQAVSAARAELSRQDALNALAQQIITDNDY